MNTRLAISLLCIAAALFACGPRSRTEAPTALATALATRASGISDRVKHSERATSKNADGTLAPSKIGSSFHVQVQKNAVHFALNVKNLGPKHVEMNFHNGQAYDFVVVDSTGREVWHWSKGRLFTQAMQNKQLGRGDAIEVAETWNDPARTGHYTAIATLTSSNYPVEERVEFVVR